LFVLREDVGRVFLLKSTAAPIPTILRLLALGHAVIRDGIEFRFGAKVGTIISISRYCDEWPGLAGVLEVREGKREIAHLPSSLPFIRRKVVESIVAPGV
jgi:hypothetical protein